MSGLFKGSLAVGLVAFGLTYFVGLAAQEDAVTEFKKKLSDAVKPDEDETEEEAEEAIESDAESEEENNSDDSDDDDLF